MMSDVELGSLPRPGMKGQPPSAFWLAARKAAGLG
jgi:hypothetical protein